MDAKQLAENSKKTFDRFAGMNEIGAFRDLLKKAKGVFISPQVLEGAFIFGLSGGSGVLVARDPGTTVDELVKLNNLKDKNVIYPGQ